MHPQSPQNTNRKLSQATTWYCFQWPRVTFTGISGNCLERDSWPMMSCYCVTYVDCCYVWLTIRTVWPCCRFC